MPGDTPRKVIKRTAYPAVAVLSLLAVLNPVDQAPRDTAHAKPVSGPGAIAGRPVDGGHPLFLQPPPPLPQSPPQSPSQPAQPGIPPTNPNPGPVPAPGGPAQAATLPAFGIPATVLAAYQRAEQRLGQTIPGCHLAWPVLAGIGKVESNHARNGDVTPAGEMIDPIFGPSLNGSSGFAAISDPSGGWARAAGPMQFIPSTWARWGIDGNGDGRADVQNVVDSALSAADYLCADGRDLSTGPGLRDAILSYNDSPQYLDTVAAWIRAYQNNGGPVPDQPYGPGTFTDPSEVSGTAPSGTGPSGQSDPRAAASSQRGSGGSPSGQSGSGAATNSSSASGSGSAASPPASGGTTKVPAPTQQPKPTAPAPAPLPAPVTTILPPPAPAPAPISQLPPPPLG